jgi:hypothetical protein
LEGRAGGLRGSRKENSPQNSTKDASIELRFGERVQEGVKKL